MEKEREQEENGSCKSEEEIDLFHTVKTPMSANMTIIGLVNGMIGGTCLVLPHIGLQTGYLMFIIVCSLIGFVAYYTAYLIILHLGKGTQIKDCILSHFDNNYNYMVAYSFVIWLSFIPGLLIYFRIICLQIEGLMGYHSDSVGPLVAIGLVILVIIIRIFHVGEETLAFGIISIVGYVFFLVWAQITAPEGPITVPAIANPVKLAATLSMALTVHDFLVANIIKNPNRSEYHSIVRKTFFIGVCTYIFICFGSFAIVNRHPTRQRPETINHFFKKGEWQNALIEVVYMLHMVTAFPNFLIISKVRFFQMFKIELHHKIDWHEAVYIAVCIIGSYFVYVSGLSLDVMITLNGAVIIFFYMLVIPIWVHFRCVFWSRSSGYIEDDPEWNSEIVPNECQCNNVYRSKWLLYLQTIFLCLCIALGMWLMVFSVLKVAQGKIN